MKNLLPAIQTALQAGLTAKLAKTSDCYIAPTSSWQPDGTGPVAVGICSAGMDRIDLAGQCTELEATVEISGFVPMAADGKEVICGNTGLYALMDAVSALLFGNTLGLADVQGVKVGSDSKPEMYQAASKIWLVKMDREFIYTMER